MAARAMAAIKWTSFHSVKAYYPCVATFGASYRLNFDRHLQRSCIKLNDNQVAEEAVKSPKVLKGTAGRFGSKIPATRSTLPFEEFIENRRKLKFRSRIAGVPFGLLGLTASSMVSAYTFPNMFDTPPEEIQPILGMDPILFCASAGLVVSLCSFVSGSSLYRLMWRITNKEYAKKMEEREKDFLQRIEANRASNSYGTSKYEDDHYGDTVNTLSDYRQWLRKQQQKRQDAIDSANSN